MTAYSIAHGDVISVLKSFRDNAFDALACDPPYGLRFMGKAWDYDVPSVELWRECLRVLKPGAPLVAFGGGRTYHRLACAVEDAGFELRDQLLWLYGKGFPKSLDVGKAIDKSAGATREVVGMGAAHCEYIARGEKCPGHGDVGRYGETVHAAETAAATPLAKAWDGYGTALKPAHEPIVLARKPLDGTVAQNVARWGVGGLAIDACRIGEAGGTRKEIRPGVCQHCGADTPYTDWAVCQKCHDAGRSDARYAFGDGLNGNAPVNRDIGAGRWPANLILDEQAAALLDAAAGNCPSAPYRANDAAGAVLPLKQRTAGGYADGGGPSRFFYCSKVSTKEREAGCEHLVKKSAGEATERDDVCEACEGKGKVWAEPAYGHPSSAPCRDCAGSGRVRTAGLENPRAGAGRTGGARNHHPTLKPISLTTWLTRLIMPPTPGVILVPFAGAGSEMIGAVKAGWRGVFGIEREASYVEIARARLAHWCGEAQAA